MWLDRVSSSESWAPGPVPAEAVKSFDVPSSRAGIAGTSTLPAKDGYMTSFETRATDNLHKPLSLAEECAWQMPVLPLPKSIQVG